MDGERYGAMLERDATLSRSLVSAIVPEEYLDEFVRSIDSKYISGTGRVWSHRVGFIYNCAIIFAESKKWDHKVQLQYSDLARMVNLVNYRDSINLFQNASETVQTHIYMMSPWINLSAVNVYLRSATYLNLQSLRYVGNDRLIRRDISPARGKIKLTEEHTAKCITEISDAIHCDAKDSAVRESLDLSKTKLTLRNKLMERNLMLPAFGDLTVPIFVMWKAIFGQKTVLDLLQKFSTSDAILTPDSFMMILEDWKNLSPYPAEWIVEAGNYSIIEP